MNIKIIYHIMPWEIDYALLTFTQLKKSKYYLPSDVNITIDTVLNLSSNLINWDLSELPKAFFIEKYNQISPLLHDYIHNSKIYDGTELYGHLNLQRDAVGSEFDYYMSICPDIHFNEYVLSYLVESLRHINNEYFVLTPQIPRMWDTSWDVLTNEKYMNHPNELWDSIDVFDINVNEEPSLISINTGFKWAGWFDIYSKSFFEKLAPVSDEWNGYGAWDFYGINLVYAYNQLGGNFMQYILKNQLIFEYSVGPLKTESIHGFSNYYKKFITCTDVDEQRQSFNKNLDFYIQSHILKLNTILC